MYRRKSRNNYRQLVIFAVFCAFSIAQAAADTITAQGDGCPRLYMTGGTVQIGGKGTLIVSHNAEIIITGDAEPAESDKLAGQEVDSYNGFNGSAKITGSNFSVGIIGTGITLTAQGDGCMIPFGTGTYTLIDSKQQVTNGNWVPPSWRKGGNPHLDPMTIAVTIGKLSEAQASGTQFMKRNIVASIMFYYANDLFHEGKLYEMVDLYESAVTLNPAFSDAWSYYGWHLAWNLSSDTSDNVQKAKWLKLGKSVFIRAIVANPDKPKHRADLANLYMNREGNYRKALNVLEPVIYPYSTDKHQFKPLTAALSKDMTNTDVINERLWDVNIGRQMAIIYQKLGIVTGDWNYFKKAMKLYKFIQQENPGKSVGEAMERLRKPYEKRDMAWLREKQQDEMMIRVNFKFSKVHFGDPIKKLFPDGSTGIPGEKPRY